jgi:GNAT superfamily N-acetyltransferase
MPSDAATESPARDKISLRTFAPADLPALVAFWNGAFSDRHNFRPITAEQYSKRVLAHPAFDARGLLLAWRQGRGDATLVGIAHAFRPAPQQGPAAAWGEGHALALLYVQPDARGQGVGSRLMQAVENWLYYCPVLVGWPGTPAYGTVEGYHAPFFGSSEHMGVSARDGDLTRFLSGRGYRVAAPGDVSLALDLSGAAARWAAAPAPPPALNALGLRLVEFSHLHPFTGNEPPDRHHFTTIGHNNGEPYIALALVDGIDQPIGHAVWYPLAAGRLALSDFRVAPKLRNRGLGGYLLDSALHRVYRVDSPGDATQVELMTHLLRNAPAVRLYEARGFAPVEAWVQMEKT